MPNAALIGPPKGSLFSALRPNLDSPSLSADLGNSAAADGESSSDDGEVGGSKVVWTSNWRLRGGGSDGNSRRSPRSLTDPAKRPSHRRAVRNWRRAKAAAQRKVTKEMLGPKRRYSLFPQSHPWVCSPCEGHERVAEAKFVPPPPAALLRTQLARNGMPNMPDFVSAIGRDAGLLFPKFCTLASCLCRSFLIAPICFMINRLLASELHEYERIVGLQADDPARDV